MKKILYAILFSLFFGSQLWGQSFEILNPKGNSINTSLDPDDTYKNYKIEGSIKNLTNNKLNIVWELETLEIAEGWIYTVCDAIACLPDIPTSSFELESSQTALFEIGTITSGTPGNGKYRVTIYEEGKKSQAIVKEYNFKLTSPLSTEEELINSSIKIGPNPTSETLYITNNDLKINSIQLYNLQGVRVLNKSVNANQPIQNISLEGLEAGSYLVLINVNNTYFSRKINKL